MLEVKVCRSSHTMSDSVESLSDMLLGYFPQRLHRISRKVHRSWYLTFKRNIYLYMEYIIPFKEYNDLFRANQGRESITWMECQ